MKKVLQIFLIVALATIFSCNHFKKHVEQMEGDGDKGLVEDADKIHYSHHGGSMAPKYNRGYTMTITEDNLHLAINSYSDTLLTKDFEFTAKKWQALKERLKDLEAKGKIDESEIPDGGTSEELYLFKKGREIFHGEDYGRTKNFTGADIDLSDLVPDLKEIVDATRKEN